MELIDLQAVKLNRLVSQYKRIERAEGSEAAGHWLGYAAKENNIELDSLLQAIKNPHEAG